MVDGLGAGRRRGQSPSHIEQGRWDSILNGIEGREQPLLDVEMACTKVLAYTDM